MTIMVVLLALVLSASIRHRESERSMLYLGVAFFAGLLTRFGNLMLCLASAIENLAESVPRAFRDGWTAEQFAINCQDEDRARAIERLLDASRSRE
jgi:hypothetical protein